MGHRLADAERIADGEHQVADLQLVGIAELERREALAPVLDAQHREIGARSLSTISASNSRLSASETFTSVGALDHVVVGDDEAAGVDDHAGAERALHLLARTAAAGGAEEAPEERIVEQRIAGLRPPWRRRR